MRRNPEYAYEITPTDVRAALNDLLYSPNHKSNRAETFPLYHLLQVQQRLEQPTLPQSPLTAALVLGNILTELITENYHHHRVMCGLRIPQITDTLAHTKVTIADDGASNNIELMTWSWLYHYYVRVDLAIKADQFTALIGAADRTLRRYTKHGILRVTRCLIDTENKLRQQLKRDWLYTRLPIPVARTLFGREALLDRMCALMNRTCPRHIQITGPVGIGKSILAHKFIRTLIDRNQVDQLIWIDHALNLESIYAVLNANCQSDPMVFGIRSYLTRHRTVVVIDGIDHLELAELDQLQADLGRAILIMIGQQYVPLQMPTAHILVPELEPESAINYLCYLLDLCNHSTNALPDLEEILSKIRGHPGKIATWVTETLTANTLE